MNRCKKTSSTGAAPVRHEQHEFELPATFSCTARTVVNDQHMSGACEEAHDMYECLHLCDGYVIIIITLLAGDTEAVWEKPEGSDSEPKSTVTQTAKSID